MNCHQAAVQSRRLVRESCSLRAPARLWNREPLARAVLLTRWRSRSRPLRLPHRHAAGLEASEPVFLAAALDRRPMSGPLDADADLVARLVRGDVGAME